MSFASGTSRSSAGPPSSSLTETRLIRGTLIGLAVMLVCIPIHWFFVSSSYSAGYYIDAGELVPLLVVVIALAVRFGSDAHGVYVAAIALTLGVIYLVASEYLTAHFLINQSVVAQGYPELPLVLNPSAALGLMVLYFQNDPIQLLWWLLGLGGSALMTLAPSLGSARYGLSGKPPATARPQPALASTAPPLQLGASPAGFGKASSQSIPIDARSLGDPLQVYKTRVTGLMLLGGIFIVLALVFAAITFGSRSIPSLMIYPGGLALLFFVLGAYRIVVALLNLNNQVIIFTDGISISQNGLNTTMRWVDVQAVWQYQQKLTVNMIPIIDTHFYRITRRDSFEIEVGKTYEKIGDLGAAIQTAVTRVYLPQVVDALQNGKSVAFGKFTVRPDALVYRDSVYPWSEIRSVGVWQSSIRIEKNSGHGMTKWSPSIATVPNLNLFFTVVNAILQNGLPRGAITTPSKGGMEAGFTSHG